MKILHTITLAEAAKQLGVGSIALFRELRARGVLREDNSPHSYYRLNGYFHDCISDWVHPVTGRTYQRVTTRALPLGMFLLSQITQDMRRGHSSTTATPAQNQHSARAA